MRAVTADFVNKAGSPRISEVDQPTIADGELLVRMSYGGMNAADWQYAQGMVTTMAEGNLNILGFEGSGVVERVAPDVTTFRAGDRVMFARSRATGDTGTFADYVAFPANLARRVPDWMSMEDAGATPICFLTSYISLFADDLGNGKPGQKILIHGGSGGVGSFAIQLAKYGGLFVAATGRAVNKDYMIGMGADHAIDYTDPDKSIVAQTREWAPEGVDIVFDAVRQNTLPNALDALKPGGTLVSISTGLDTSNLDEQMLASQALGFKHVRCFAHWPERIDKTPFSNILEQQAIRIPPVEVVELADLQSAIERLRNGHNRGKLVLNMTGG
ncbi:NADP-dependent oxidoreductase [Sphingobium sp. AN558]|uniref:NADP-dependent oxidoreductase n=1 Tax=Sphingobium sp. AN558 TaxID=3133442 RepID=UPI0030C4D2F8